MFGLGESVVVGYDLSSEYAQISYMGPFFDMPKTISIKEGAEQLNIPVCLFKRLEVNQWFYGEDAVNYSKMEEGELVDNLWERALVGDAVEVVDEDFDPISLLVLYIKRSLSLLLNEVKKDSIAGIMFTVPNLTKRAIEVLEVAVSMLDLGKTVVGFQGREESIYYYITHQPEELRKYEVMVYDFSGDYMRSFRYHENKNTKPIVSFVDKQDHNELTLSDGDKDSSFASIVEETIGTKLVNCAYLIGDGFNGDWCNESLRVLCQHRRAFRGNNLYSRGACYAMKERLNDGKNTNRSRIFLGVDKLKSNIGMKVMRKNEESYLAILDGGTNWFEAKKEYELIIDKGNSFTITITPLDGRNVRDVEIILDGLNERESRTTRIRLETVMESDSMLRVNVTDLGFGDIYAASNQMFTKEISLND